MQDPSYIVLCASYSRVLLTTMDTLTSVELSFGGWFVWFFFINGLASLILYNGTTLPRGITKSRYPQEQRLQSALFLMLLYHTSYRCWHSSVSVL